jgi:excisionase family DNA binding protein
MSSVKLVSDLLADHLEFGHISISGTRGAPAEVLTLEEAAELLRLPRDEVALLAQEGELPGRGVGGEWRVARAAVLLWLSSGGQPVTGAD